MAHTRFSIIIILFLVILVMVVGQSKEILIDDERPIIKVDSHEEYPHENNDEPVEHSPCHMEYQVYVVKQSLLIGMTVQLTIFLK